MRKLVLIYRQKKAAGEELEIYKRRAQIADLVDNETSKDAAEKSKPHPDIFDAALEKLEGISAGEVIVGRMHRWGCDLGETGRIANDRRALRWVSGNGIEECRLRRNFSGAPRPACALRRLAFAEVNAGDGWIG